MHILSQIFIYLNSENNNPLIQSGNLGSESEENIKMVKKSKKEAAYSESKNQAKPELSSSSSQQEISLISWDLIHNEFGIRVTTTPSVSQSFRQQRRFGGTSYRSNFYKKQ